MGPALGDPDNGALAASDDGERLFVKRIGAEHLGAVGVPCMLREGLRLGVETFAHGQFQLDAATANDRRRRERRVGDRAPDTARSRLGLLEEVHALERHRRPIPGEGLDGGGDARRVHLVGDRHVRHKRPGQRPF